MTQDTQSILRVSKKSLQNLIKGAFAYHPYGMQTLMRKESWVIGPTFGVVYEGDLPAIQTTVWHTPSNTEKKWDDLLTAATKADTVVEIEKETHNKDGMNCTARAIKGTNYEVAYALYKLARALDIEEYRMTGLVVCGYKKDEPRILFAAKVKHHD